MSGSRLIQTRRSILKTAGALAGAGLTAGCSVRASGEWRCSLPWSVREFHTSNAKRFADTVFEQSNGRLDIGIYPGAILGVKGPETIRILEEGIVEMAEMPAFQGVGSEPLLGLESLPFLVLTQGELKTLYDILRPVIEDIYRSHGLRIAYIVPWPNQNIYTRVAAPSLAALQGLKIRTYDRNTSDLMERLGLVPVQMPSQDVVPALASGVIDAVMTSTTTGAAQNYWSFLKYIYRTNHVWISNIMAVNGAAFDRLAVDVQAIFEETAATLEPDFWRVSADDDQTQLKILIDNGIEERVPDPEFLAEMQALARPMWREFGTRVGDPAPRIIDTFLERTGKQAL